MRKTNNQDITKNKLSQTKKFNNKTDGNSISYKPKRKCKRICRIKIGNGSKESNTLQKIVSSNFQNN